MFGKDDIITALTRTLHFYNLNCIATIENEHTKSKRNLQECCDLTGTLQGKPCNKRDMRQASKLKLGVVYAQKYLTLLLNDNYLESFNATGSGCS